MLGESAGLRRVVLDLVVEHGEVQAETQSDGVGGLELLLGLLAGSLVGGEGVVTSLGVGVTAADLGDVSVVVSLHLVVEDFALGGLGPGDEGLGEEIDEVLADADELALDLLLVLSDVLDVSGLLLGVLLLLE